jgi:hypothetical protein
LEQNVNPLPELYFPLSQTVQMGDPAALLYDPGVQLRQPALVLELGILFPLVPGEQSKQIDAASDDA